MTGDRAGISESVVECLVGFGGLLEEADEGAHVGARYVSRGRLSFGMSNVCFGSTWHKNTHGTHISI